MMVVMATAVAVVVVGWKALQAMHPPPLDDDATVMVRAAAHDKAHASVHKRSLSCRRHRPRREGRLVAASAPRAPAVGSDRAPLPVKVALGRHVADALLEPRNRRRRLALLLLASLPEARRRAGVCACAGRRPTSRPPACRWGTSIGPSLMFSVGVCGRPRARTMPAAPNDDGSGVEVGWPAGLVPGNGWPRRRRVHDGWSRR